MSSSFNEKKFNLMFWVCNKWLYLKNINKNLTEHQLIANEDSIAVYGLGEIGKRVIEELQNNGKKIAYAIDKNADAYFAEFGLYTAAQELPQANLIIVTPVAEFKDIQKTLETKTNAKIVSIETLINDLWLQCWPHDE